MKLDPKTLPFEMAEYIRSQGDRLLAKVPIGFFPDGVGISYRVKYRQPSLSGPPTRRVDAISLCKTAVNLATSSTIENASETVCQILMERIAEEAERLFGRTTEGCDQVIALTPRPMTKRTEIESLMGTWKTFGDDSLRGVIMMAVAPKSDEGIAQGQKWSPVEFG